MYQVKIFKFFVWNPCILSLGDICNFEQIFWIVGNSFLNSTGKILSSKTTTFSRDWLCSRSCCSRPSSDCLLSSISTFHNAFFLSLSAFNWSRKSWISKLSNYQTQTEIVNWFYMVPKYFLLSKLIKLIEEFEIHIQNQKKKN